MSDLTELFNRVAPDVDATPGADVIDADLARGRTALARDHRRRTIRRSLASGATIAAAIAVTVALTQTGGGTAAPHRQAGGHQAIFPKAHDKTTPTVHRAAPVRLVSYNGKQLAGFTVDKVPTGWFLSTSTQFALLINPDGATNNNPDVFEGKLAVLTQSSDVHGLPKDGTPVTVDGQAGVVTDQGSYGINLAYNAPSGFGVVIQAPPALHWSPDQIVAFADGVHVTGNAIPGKG